MAQAAAKKTKQGKSINPQTLYALEEFKQVSGMGNWALRAARNAGLKMLKVGNRKYIKGQAFIDFLESTNSNEKSPE